MTALIVIIALVAMVWGTALMLRGSPVLGGAIYLIVASVAGVHFLTVEAGISLSLDRLCIAAVVLGFLVHVWRGDLAWQAPQKVDWVLAALLLWLLLSAFTHDWQSVSADQVPVIPHLINGYLIPAALFLVARNSKISEKSGRAVLWLLGGFGVYLAAVGIAEAAGAWALVFPRYIADPEVGLHYGRARGPMVHSVSYGFYLACTLLALWVSRQHWGRLGYAFLLAITPLFSLAVFFTKTRSVWAGFACGVMVVLAGTLKGKMRVAVLGAMVFAALGAVALKHDAILSLEREGTAADTRQSAGMRTSFAYVSWRMFLDRPLLGFGFGQFADAKLPYLSDRNVDLPLEQIRGYVHHNTFLALLTETGLIGMTLYLVLLGLWAWNAWRLLHSSRAPPWAQRYGILMLGVLAVAVWQMAAHEITFMPYEHALLFFIAGIACGLRYQYEPATTAATAWQWQTGGWEGAACRS